MFGQGVRHGATIHKAFSYWEMVSEKHFFDVEESFLHLSIFSHLMTKCLHVAKL